jgi:tetratricopeptide (TPR) repeat protein
MADGKSKAALDSAKELHKKVGSADSESLLIDAYLLRIRALSDQNMALEAKSLGALVGERFPAARERLEALSARVAGQGSDLDELLRPLNDPELSADRRASIEQIIQNQITDLASLAGCAALPPEHRLRTAAAAIDRAFNSVTSGPVTDEQIALPEVSHRSPLANWKLLIRAIACFYRNQDEACAESLAAINPESAPSRLVPAMQAMLAPTPGEKPAAGTSAGDLKPAGTALVARTNGSLRELRRALSDLDEAFAQAPNPAQVFKAARAAVRECRQSAPDLLVELQRRAAIRGEVAGLDCDRMIAALEGGPRPNALFFRDLARELERTGDNEDLMRASEYWDSFRQEALREKWIAEDSLEMAALYLHMAEVLGRMPGELLRQMQAPTGKAASRERNYFRFRGDLYSLASRIDAHPDCYSQWLRWARKNGTAEAEEVARAWSKALPDAVEPLLFLMEEAEKRHAFPTALSYLDKAERIDGVHSTIRMARLRLLARAAMRHLQKKKPHLAAQKLEEILALPQSRQGDRPAFLSALQGLICLASNDTLGADQAFLGVEMALGDGLAALLFVFGCAAAAKRNDLVTMPAIHTVSEDRKSRLPGSMARAVMLASDIGLTQNFRLPFEYFDETEARFPRAVGSLNVEQIRVLGELGLATEHPRLAWAASAAGLDRGGPTEAYFLLLRARALPHGMSERYEALAAAAAELGRAHRDMEVVSQAVEAGRELFDEEPMSLTAEQARDVLRREKASPAFPAFSVPGPDYSDLSPDDRCMCPTCRAGRGESVDDDSDNPFEGPDERLDEAEMRRIFFEKAPPGIPRDMLPALYDAASEAFSQGADPMEIIAQMLFNDSPGRKKKKGRRR